MQTLPFNKEDTSASVNQPETSKYRKDLKHLVKK